VKNYSLSCPSLVAIKVEFAGKYTTKFKTIHKILPNRCMEGQFLNSIALSTGSHRPSAQVQFAMPKSPFEWGFLGDNHHPLWFFRHPTLFNPDQPTKA